MYAVVPASSPAHLVGATSIIVLSIQSNYYSTHAEDFKLAGLDILLNASGIDLSLASNL